MSFSIYSEKKRISPEELSSFRKRINGRTLATLNGSFDLMHAGHLEIIYAASLKADILLVALNSDASIQQYKGPKRPIVPLEYRLRLMSALAFVDFVTWFDEADPCSLLRKVRPDIHVNGADWGTNCIEASTLQEIGARLEIIPLIEGLSTSSLIQKIKSL
ncbi:MAG: adenylyltransferase/cytidyltransferase family protein [Chlamydiae bacterium]|nr:adenylyltransferase/cytidyltransferase family protein [Chlamydiota bacterium]